MSPSRSVATLMQLVLLALLPTLAAHYWVYGPGSLVNLIALNAIALALDGLCARLRQQAITYERVLSTLVAASLLALALPSAQPLWLLLVGAALLILLGREVFGGLGQNIFNPAMVAYAGLLLSFPAQFAVVSDVTTLAEAVAFAVGGTTVDGYSGATLLTQWRADPNARHIATAVAGSGEYLRAIAAVLGAVLLLGYRAIDWRIPLSMLLAVAALGTAFDAFTLHLLGGATLLGAVFIATDPVTAATSAAGRWVYGGVIGVLLVLIRQFGQYPDAVAFAVLLANAAVPLIDTYLPQWKIRR